MKLNSKSVDILSIATLMGLFLIGCGGETLAGKWKYKEINRLKSPDGLVEAVIVTGDSGATSSMVTMICLVSAGAAIEDTDKEKPIFKADLLKNFKIDWKAPKLLTIHYEEARISTFMNYWCSKKVKDYHYLVEVRLDPTRADFSLPLELKTFYNQ